LLGHAVILEGGAKSGLRASGLPQPGQHSVIHPHSVSNTPFASQVLPADADLKGIISRLYVYPIKSCAGIAVTEAILTETGLEFDRAWMVVDAKGNFLTQRELPRMALIQPKLKSYEMVLRAPGMLALHIQLNEVEAPVKVTLWGDDIPAFDMGTVAAQWFTDFLGVPARLVRFDPDHRRVSSRQWTGDAEALNQFNDGFPMLLVSEASLNQLNEKLVAAGFTAVEMERFRPNIVIGSAPARSAMPDAMTPHDEDRVSLLQVETGQGLVDLKPVKPCKRCPIPNIDPATALSSPEVNDTLQGYKQDPRMDGAVTFGMNVVALNGLEHVLKVGQPVAASYTFE
jgi:uncharacterized protein YcbX